VKTVSRKRRVVDILILAGVPLMFYSCVDGMIFCPPDCSYRDRTDTNNIPVGEGQHIAAYYLPPKEAGDLVVLFSHGNAEDVGHNMDFAQVYNYFGFGILVYDYRGYGLSTGRPSEKNTYEDIEAAYRFLVDEQKIEPSRIIAHGRSVGSGPSTYLAQRYPLGGLILESPFVSAFRVVTRVPILPFDRYPNLRRMKDIQCPVLVIHGKEDEIVGFWHGERLYQAAGEPKMKYWVESAGHNDLLDCAGEQYWETLLKFKALVNQAAEKHEGEK
jgi:abhydrolase domain-containing protein 17